MIVFVPREDWDAERGEIYFPVSVIGTTVMCRVEAAAVDCEMAGGEALLAAFRAQRQDYEARIRRKLLQGQYEADRSILIRAVELAP